MKVLIISGHPDPSQRSLHDFFKSDSNVKLTHFSTLRPPEKQDATPLKELALMPFPVHEIFGEELKNFDLIVLDRYAMNGTIHMPYLERIADHVRNGGGLMVIAGPEYAGSQSIYNTPLGKILPAAPTGKISLKSYRPTLTEAGERHPVTRPLSGEHGAWHKAINVQPSSAAIVAMHAADNSPLLVLNHQGNGRVAVVLSDQASLWAYGHDGGGPYAGLIGNTARWLLRDSTMDEESLGLRQQDNQLLVTVQTMSEKANAVMVRSPSGTAITLNPNPVGPGLWQATLPIEERGLYSVEKDSPQGGKAYTYVGPENPREFENPLSTPDILRPLADRSGGVVTRMTDSSGQKVDIQIRELTSPDAPATPDYFHVRMNTQTVTTGSKREPAIPDAALLALIVGLFGAGLYRHSELSLFRRKEEPKP
jgi:hypothetical protein